MASVVSAPKVAPGQGKKSECSTPYGISGFGTRLTPCGINGFGSAQRLAASMISAQRPQITLAWSTEFLIVSTWVIG
jgi:hypothetical protein